MSKLHEIKRAKKASLLLKTISSLFYQIVRDDQKLQGLSITRLDLSPDKSHCYIFFYIQEGEEAFKSIMEQLILYKPSLRAAVSRSIAGRYTPELIFKFDTSFEKSQRIESLITKLKEQGEM